MACRRSETLARVSSGVSVLLLVVTLLLISTVSSATAREGSAQQDRSARGVNVLPAVRVSDVQPVSRTYEGPTVAVNPNEPETMYVASSDLQARRCDIWQSRDAGVTFVALEGPDFGELTDCGLNKGGIAQNIRMDLVVDGEGVVYWAVAVADPIAAGPRSVVLARSVDEGASWQTTMVADAPVPADPNAAFANFEPSLFVDPFGSAPRTVWISWRRSFADDERSTEGWAAVSSDGGETFGDAVRAFELDPGFDAPRIVMDSDGTVFWFQKERPPSPDEGEESPPHRLVMAHSSDGGRLWQQVEIDQAQSVLEEPLAGVSTDGDTLYLTWADARNGDLDIFFMRSTDRGQSWSEPLRVNDDPVGNLRSQKWPTMSIAPNGRVDIAWYDYRHDTADVPEDDLEFFLGAVNDVYYAYSKDGGRTFSANLRATERSIDRTFGTYNPQYSVEVPPGLGSGNQRTVLAWSDTRMATLTTQAQDIYAAPAEFATRGFFVIPTLTVLAALGGAGIALLAAALMLSRRRPPSPQGDQRQVPVGADH